MSHDESILLKKHWRSDAVWTRPFIYKSFLKLVPLYFDTRALMRSQYWFRARIDSLQSQQLQALFKNATRIPFWRDVFAVSAGGSALTPREILAQLPITSKKDFVEKKLDTIAYGTLLAKSDADHTSGSTGKPFHFYHDWHASLRSFAFTERIFRTATGKRYPIVYIRSRPRNGFTFYRHVWFFVRGFTSIRYRMDAFQKQGEKLKGGFILYGYTSWIVELAKHMERTGMVLPIRAVMVAGEYLGEADKKYIEHVMKAELFTLYASREVGFLGYECEKHRMHISEEWAYLEIVDEKGHALPDGNEGRIIVTTFDNQVMPFIRYDIGDLGVIAQEPCECGRTLKTLTFKGRVTELIELEDNRVVSLLDIAYALGTFRDAVIQYQIVQKSAISFVFKIVPGPQFEAQKEYLEPLMVRLLHPRVRIQWEMMDIIPPSESGKAAYFVRDFENV